MRPETTASPAAPLLRAERLSITFGGIKAVTDFDLTVGDGEIVSLIGPNGAGKTTCFNMLTGFYRPTGGTAQFRGQVITGLKPHAIARRGLVRSFQKTSVMKNLTVFENVVTGHYLQTRQSLMQTFLFEGASKRAAEAARQRSAEIVQLLGLGTRSETPAHHLSCGDLRLLEVGVALAARPTLLMLDEPAAGLNTAEANAFGEVLRTIVATQVRSLLLVEHNMGLVMGVSDRIVVMNFGRKLIEGTPAEILGSDEVREAYLGKGAAGKGAAGKGAGR
ncbi:ABC transporter ATP-binding protein [Methylobacterium frigidaeris]|uniref:Lipopolysaccharide export system ATP-binding protein LptB n=1 Tax=Methylobacterium frigidaeris TaxID=2038277 RepID=A0AA37M6G1_9HYPH|nr:ABC transporter ATP-binding protein [Methylobacterium frigidaeris]PIK71634.1 ABC transporter ATP-binding protein [Methylobacterium frigidaeris]GJD64480.1 Lipopolysaccharide export system ATP-binding protein LptB [Methylobacterium frigidaeris]